MVALSGPLAGEEANAIPTSLLLRAQPPQGSWTHEILHNRDVHTRSHGQHAQSPELKTGPGSVPLLAVLLVCLALQAGVVLVSGDNSKDIFEDRPLVELLRDTSITEGLSLQLAVAVLATLPLGSEQRETVFNTGGGAGLTLFVPTDEVGGLHKKHAHFSRITPPFTFQRASSPPRGCSKA